MEENLCSSAQNSEPEEITQTEKKPFDSENTSFKKNVKILLIENLFPRV